MGNLAGKGVGSGEQPIRELVTCISEGYGVRSYGCKPMGSSVTKQKQDKCVNMQLQEE